MERIGNCSVKYGAIMELRDLQVVSSERGSSFRLTDEQNEREKIRRDFTKRNQILEKANGEKNGDDTIYEASPR